MAIVGTALPLFNLFTYIMQFGFHPMPMIQFLFDDPLIAFVSWDVVISAMVLISFITFEGLRIRMKHQWLPIVATLTVGVSLGLPLFLFMRELRLERE